jgi:pimeloyl-ACP methyl ester carboxylesterase
MSATSPALVLVPGAWHSASDWDAVISHLPGVEARAVELPSHGTAATGLGDMYDDAAAVRAAIDAISGPVVVISHSYGGVPSTQAAAGSDAVNGLIYVAAFQLDVGDSLLSSVGGVGPDWWDVHEDEGYLDVLHPEDVFWGDLTPQATKKAVAQAGHLGLETIRQPLTHAAWRSVPSAYVITEKDNAIPVPAQEAMAKRAQRVRRINSCHSPFLSQPENMAALIREELPAFTAAGNY